MNYRAKGAKTEETTRFRGARTALFRTSRGTRPFGDRERIAATALILLTLLIVASCRTTKTKSPGRPVLARGRILALVSDPGGRPVAGVRLTLTASDGAPTAVATTARDGTAGFDNLSEGRYTLRAQAPGARRSRSAHVAVRAGLESTAILTVESDEADTVIVKPKR